MLGNGGYWKDPQDGEEEQETSALKLDFMES
jgi:hypothetical protein